MVHMSYSAIYEQEILGAGLSCNIRTSSGESPTGSDNRPLPKYTHTHAHTLPLPLPHIYSTYITHSHKHIHTTPIQECLLTANFTKMDATILI